MHKLPVGVRGHAPSGNNFKVPFPGFLSQPDNILVKNIFEIQVAVYFYKNCIHIYFFFFIMKILTNFRKTVWNEYEWIWIRLKRANPVPKPLLPVCNRIFAVLRKLFEIIIVASTVKKSRSVNNSKLCAFATLYT